MVVLPIVIITFLIMQLDGSASQLLTFKEPTAQGRAGMYHEVPSTPAPVRVAPAPAPTPVVSSVPTSLGVHEAVNEERIAMGLLPLDYDKRLERSACAKAADMVRQGYWGHVGPDGTSPWYFIEQQGIHYRRVGENLAYGYRTDQKVVTAWMNSRGHRQNLLGDFTTEGICAYKYQRYHNSNRPGILVVQHLMKPREMSWN